MDKRLAMAAVVLTLGASAARADVIESVSFSYTDPNAGNLTASGTLLVDTTTGQALSGSGILNSTLFVESDGVTPLGDQNITLVTASSTNIVNPNPAGGGFLWQDSDGTNIQADTAFSTTSPYVDSNGLLFAVGVPTANGHYGSFNFYFNDSGAVLGDFLGHGGPPAHGQVWQGNTNGTLTINSVTPVPAPAAAWLLLAGLPGVIARARSRRPA